MTTGEQLSFLLNVTLNEILFRVVNNNRKSRNCTKLPKMIRFLSFNSISRSKITQKTSDLCVHMNPLQILQTFRFFVKIFVPHDYYYVHIEVSLQHLCDR